MSPDEENAVLSQDDIDGLVSSSTEIGGETAASSPPAAPEAAAGAAAPAGDGAGLGALTERLARLEAAVAKLTKDGGAGGSQELAQQVQALTKRVNDIFQHLPNTLGYGVHETFQCPACSAKGTVAAHVMCTQCGGETAIGWWPPQAQ